MADIRQDPVSGRWVIVATERVERPRDFTVPRLESKGGFCPFCEGNEDRTPPEIAAVRMPGSHPDGPGWKVRVVPNKYPALSPEAPFACSRNGLYQACAGYGAHEVIIEQPGHILSPTRLAPEDFGLVVRTYCERSRVLAADRQLAYVLIFKNVGERAGASLEHSHSQIIAVPVMPRRVAEEIQRCAAYHDDTGRCLFCAIIEEERRDRQRVVIETDEFLVVCPYAGRFPFEMWLMPKAHSEHFMALDETGAGAAAVVLHEALSRLESCLDDPPFNFAIHTAPVSGVDAGHYHWHVEIIPRVTHVAGFEWGTGFYINPVAPEQAAECLRKVSAEDLSVRAAASMARDG